MICMAKKFDWKYYLWNGFLMALGVGVIGLVYDLAGVLAGALSTPAGLAVMVVLFPFYLMAVGWIGRKIFGD